MKPQLLLFLALSFSVYSFCQTETKTIKEPIKVYTLDEVILDYSGSKIKCSGNSRKVSTIITTTTGCRLYCTVKCMIIEETSVSELNSVKLFPNPSINGEFQIDLSKKYNTIRIDVSSISGQTIQTKKFQNVRKNVKIDLSQYPKGIYVINIIADGNSLPSKKAIRG